MDINTFVIESIIANTDITIEELYIEVCSECEYVFGNCDKNCCINQYAGIEKE